jgi:hypothetical protein
MSSRPIRFERGAISLLPDTPWLGGCVANTGRGELAAVSEPFTVNDATQPLAILADGPCRLDVALLAADAFADPCTWHALQRTTPRHLARLMLSRPALTAALSPLPQGRWRLVVRRLDRDEATLAVAATLQPASPQPEAAHVFA